MAPMPKVSAGLLLYKITEDGALAVLLVHPGGPFWQKKDVHAWSIPKGEYEEGEDAERAAEREFVEELGLPVPAGPRLDLGTVRQASGKYVRAWAIRADDFTPEHFVSNRFEMEWPPKSGRQQEFPEVDRAQWVAAPEANDRLVAAQGELVDRLVSLLRADTT
jgi:predicted NUDIX family NTP pyrophosphohydrolase